MGSLLVLVCGFIGLAYAADQAFIDQAMQRMKTFLEECTIESGVSSEDLLLIAQRKLPSSQSGKCFISCYDKKFGILNAQGKLDLDGTMNAMKDLKVGDPEKYEVVKKLNEYCMANVPDEESECDTAANLLVCYNDHADEMGLEPGIILL